MRTKLNITEGIFPLPVLMVAPYNEDGTVNGCIIVVWNRQTCLSNTDYAIEFLSCSVCFSIHRKINDWIESTIPGESMLNNNSRCHHRTFSVLLCRSNLY